MKMDFTEKNLGPAHGLLELLYARTIAQEMAIKALIPLNFHAQAALQKLAESVDEAVLPHPTSVQTRWLIQQHLLALATPLK
jgi:hypothetical protein